MTAARIAGYLSGLALLVYTLTSLAGDAPRRHRGHITFVAHDTIYFCNSHTCYQVPLASVQSFERDRCTPSGKISVLGYVTDEQPDYSLLTVVGKAHCSYSRD